MVKGGPKWGFGSVGLLAATMMGSGVVVVIVTLLVETSGVGEREMKIGSEPCEREAGCC